MRSAASLPLLLAAAATGTELKCDKRRPYTAPTDPRLDGLLSDQESGGGNWLGSLFGGGGSAARGGERRDCGDGRDWLGAYSPEGADPSPLAAFSAEHNASLWWGSYRPGQYFGLRTRSAPAALAAGLLWGFEQPADGPLRHDCSEQDKLRRYGWVQHDGRSFGAQPINDTGAGLALRTAFVKPRFLPGGGGEGEAVEWAARIVATPQRRVPKPKRKKKSAGAEAERPPRAAVYFYLAVDCDGAAAAGAPCLALAGGPDGLRITEEPHSRAVRISGVAAPPPPDDDAAAAARQGPDTPSEFTLTVRAAAGGAEGGSPVALSWRCTEQAGAAGAADAVRAGGWGAAAPAACSLAIVRAELPPGPGGLVLDATFAYQDAAAPTSAQLDQWYAAGEAAFEAKFQRAYPEQASGTATDEAAAATARFAISNLIGGFGFFHGQLEVKDTAPGAAAALRSEPLTLFTMVPSRPFFPRGFLWDEGFHLLAAMRFDHALAAESLTRWLLTLRGSASGCPGAWMPREQALGADAARRVPDEFRAQDPRVANPPTLMLAAEALLSGAGGGAATCADPSQPGYDHARLRRALLPRLQGWSEWLAASQEADPAAYFSDAASAEGDAPKEGLYRWRGRDPGDGRLVPMTLSSGLDDYPRSYWPSRHESHADLASWVSASEASLARMLEEDSATAGAAAKHRMRAAAALAALERYHWDDAAGFYADRGMAGEVVARTEVVISCQASGGGQAQAGIPKDEYIAMQRGQSRAQPGSYCPKSHPKFQWPLGDGQGGLLERKKLTSRCPPKPGLLTEHAGYAGFMPLFLRLLPYSGESKRRVDLMVRKLSEAALLSPHGLRSLSKQSPMYQQHNAPGDEPYWRGYIWWCMNYLAASSLRHYAGLGSADAAAAHDQLRDRLVATTVGDFSKTNYLWEQYDDTTGRGRRSYPFTGWTALVANVIAGQYH
eukprot:TRINITY_DN4566_c0_g1_i1.p1 TRINITY_DN4566_c0_g1~~TRINITY_DN4566_c0_g1_i1.p1  ORF type:complete len:980 (+),score=237.83 TRINITY_DN4566_c0_g1_i1:96-2942(+)